MRVNHDLGTVLGGKDDRDQAPHDVESEADGDDPQGERTCRRVGDLGDGAGLARLGLAPTAVAAQAVDRDRHGEQPDDEIDDALGDPAEAGEGDERRMTLGDRFDLPRAGLAGEGGTGHGRAPVNGAVRSSLRTRSGTESSAARSISATPARIARPTTTMRGEPEKDPGDDVDRVVHAAVGAGDGDCERDGDGDDAEHEPHRAVAGVPAHDDEQTCVERHGRSGVAGGEASRGSGRVELLDGRAVAPDDEADDHEHGRFDDHDQGEEHAIVPAPPDQDHGAADDRHQGDLDEGVRQHRADVAQ